MHSLLEMASSRPLRLQHGNYGSRGAPHRNVWTYAQRRQQVHLRTQSDMGAGGFWPNGRMLECTRLLANDHVLEYVERTGDVFQSDAVGRQHSAEVFRAAMGRHFR